MNLDVAARAASVAEDVGREAVDLRAALPAVRRQAGLRAGVRKELLAIPSPLGRDLRQEQAAAAALFDDEAVAADLDRGGIARIDLLERPEHRDFDVEIVELGRADRIEARILARRADGDARDFFRERPRHSSVPMQPRSWPSRFSVTKAPLASGQRTRIAGGRRGGARPVIAS